MLAKYCPDVEILDQCSSAKLALESIAEHQPDLVFLDIEMPDMNGFEMLDLCKGARFETIFTTAYNEYAIQAIRHSALDYLLKPIDKTELAQSVARSRDRKSVDTSKRIEKLLEFMDVRKSSQRIALPTSDGLIMVDTKDIIYCESINNYTNFHLNTNKAILVSKTLKKVEALLESNESFFRVHHSIIINLHFLHSYVKGDGGEVVMNNGKNLPVSRNKKLEFLSKLERL